MDIEDSNLNPFYIVRKRSAWHQCVNCYADLRGSEHTETCQLDEGQKQSEIRRVQTIVKSYFNTKGIELLKGGK
jgi:hypothetical protein